METTPSSQSIVIKIIFTFVLVFIELILNSFVEASFDLSSQSIFYFNYWFIPIQIVLTGIIFIMILILMWQTFPLRYGLIGTLFKQFKWTFLVVVLFIGLTAAERGVKLKNTIDTSSDFSQVLLWDDPTYVVTYYLRFICYPIFYGFLISFCLRIIDPSYYKPNKWLK